MARTRTWDWDWDRYRDECESNPCQNGGFCIDGVSQYNCICRSGFSGTRCMTNIDECASGPCLNGGRCRDGVNHYSCICPSGFAGTRCSVEHDLEIWKCDDIFRTSSTEYVRVFFLRGRQAQNNVGASGGYHREFNPPSGSIFKAGTITSVRFTVTDENTVNISCTFKVQVQHDQRACHVGPEIPPKDEFPWAGLTPPYGYKGIRGGYVYILAADYYTIYCNGSVSSWDYFAETSAAFRAIVFRPGGNPKQWTIVGINDIPPHTAKYQYKSTYVVPYGDRISVEAGDVIGVAVGEARG
ncbi:uncharacterized protein [Amphiura filiformis]|uniref:uncharacterized protein n=1 Tax=Amphiura filiformis TaxID=82378 RepID=UPI003B228770